MVFLEPRPTSRGQSTVEMLVAVAIAMVILAYLINFTTTQVLQLQERQAVQAGQVVLIELRDAINTINTQSIGAQKKITLSFPRGIDASNTRISGKSLLMRVYGTDIFATTNAALTGSLPTTEGIKQLVLTRTANGVSIGTNSISSSAASIYLPLARDTNQLTQLALTNTSNNAATLSLSLTWNHTLVMASVVPTSGTINGSSVFDIDLNAAASASAIGNYTGILQINAVFSDHVESFSIPVNIEVFSNTGALMNVVPSSLYFTTLGADTNSTDIQICNTSNTALKSIAFIPSTGNAGDWVQGITSIATLDAQSCTMKTVTVEVPPTAQYGNYTGSLAITDYSGANSQVLPITLNVYGQANAFVWDWNGTTYSNANTLRNFLTKNISSGAIAITQLRINRWGTCDSSHSLLEALEVAETEYTLSPATDENVVNAVDISIAPNTETRSNYLEFTDNISNEGEQFQAHLVFEDGSQYSSSIYGTGCSLDLVPPGTVTNLAAARGPEFRAVQLSFTSPGDDNFTGSASDINLRFATSSIDDENEFAAAWPVLNYDSPDLNGGNTTYVIVSDLNIGPTYYFAAKFKDEAANWSALSNTANSKVYDIGSITKDPLEFLFPPAAEDVTKFSLTSVQKSAVATKWARFFFHIDSYDQTVSYTVDVNFNFDTNRVNRIRVWYPKVFAEGIDSTAADYDHNPNTAFTEVNLLDTRYIANAAYQFDPSLSPSTSLLTSNNSRFGIVSTTGLADINYTINANS